MNFAINQQRYSIEPPRDGFLDSVQMSKAMAKEVVAKEGSGDVAVLAKTIHDHLISQGGTIFRDNYQFNVPDFATLLGKPELAKPVLEAPKLSAQPEATLLAKATPKALGSGELVALHDDLAALSTREEFKDELADITDKGGKIYDRIANPGRREQAFDAVASMVDGREAVKDLLHFSFHAKGETTEASRKDARAALLIGLGEGMGMQELAGAKEALRNATPERTTALLAALNDPKTDVRFALAHFVTESRLGVSLEPIDGAKLPAVAVGSGAKVEVSRTTAQLLTVSHVVGHTVKSLVDGGASNQTPDILRTGGLTYLHYESHKGLDGGVTTGKPFVEDFARASQLDTARGASGGESMTNVIQQSRTTVARGNGKCGEHAAVSFAMLTDPKSLAQLGVHIPDGSTIVMAWGNKIDHTYCLVCEPGSVDIEVNKFGERYVSVKPGHEGNVIVVDPWMPIPVAHTLAERNDEIQERPRCMLAVKMDGGAPVVLDDKRVGPDFERRETPMPPLERSELDTLTQAKETYRPKARQQLERALPRDPRERMDLVARGVAQRVVENKPEPYSETFTSTDTPSTQYQIVDSGAPVGQPLTFLVSSEPYLSTESRHIDSGKKTKFIDDNAARLPAPLLKQVQDARIAKAKPQPPSVTI